MNKSRIFDCVTYFLEEDILLLRLENLYNFVDFFVIVESTKSYVGTDKPLYFNDNKEKFAKYADKIIHVIVEDSPAYDTKGSWKIENHLRNAIVRGLKEARPEDIILISDVDEIPRKELLFFLKSPLYNGRPISFCQQHHVYYFNVMARSNHWIGTVAIKKLELDEQSPQWCRNIKDNIPFLASGGWHLSYFGGMDKVYQKFSTSNEVLEEIPNPEELKVRLIKRVKEDGQFNIRHLNSNTLPVFFFDKPFNLPENARNYPDFFLESIESVKI